MKPLNFVLAFFLVVALSTFFTACQGCDETPGVEGSCETATDCRPGRLCEGGQCVDGSRDAGGDIPGPWMEDATTQCSGQETPCGTRCCAAGLACREGACVQDCGDAVRCNQMCCGAGQVCEDNQCRAACSGERCGAGLELCCEGEDICFGESCVTPGTSCERTEECGITEICEPSLGQCLPRDQITVCEYRPPVGALDPVVGCSWVPDGLPNPGRGDIVATPVVANLTDDNGDGLTNSDDDPNIVFPSFNRNNQGCCNVASTVRVLHGECNPDGTMRTIASINEPAVNNDTGLALADLDNSGVPEIIGVTMSFTTGGGVDRPQGTVAFKRTADDGSEWEVMWHNEDYPTWNVHTRGGATISVADLDGDGNAEVIIGNVVLNGQTGELLWDGVVTSQGTGGIGNNAFLGPTSIAADITLDGKLEVLAGNTVYDHEGNVLWTYEYTSSNSTCQGALPCDGYSAVADINQDGHPNVVIIREGEVFVLSHTGDLVWKIEIPIKTCANGNESGPPTVADFNGDGHPEIGTAGADYYVVAKMGCDVDEWEAMGCAERGILWRTETRDCSSRATASSVFDFEGDGKAEVVYADEVAFRIYDGTTGEVLFEDTRHESNTRIEMPIIADVDNDGRAEVLVPSAYANRVDRP
ncbi:MAG: FG-GAP-like repeat-containing protein, partial [Bradymonadaceae bacterium]